MSITLKQLSSAGSCGTPSGVFCAAATLGDSPTNREVTTGGTDTGTEDVNLGNQQADRAEIFYQYDADAIGYDGASGDWVLDVEVTVAGNINWEEAYICHLAGGCGGTPTILASVTGLSLSLNGTGSLPSGNINQASNKTISAGDIIMVVLVFDNNAGHGAETATIRLNSITAPGAEPAPPDFDPELFKARPVVGRLWSHFAPLLYTSVSVVSAIVAAGEPPPDEILQRPPGPVPIWDEYLPSDVNQRPPRPPPVLFEAVADRRAQVSAYELQTPDPFPDELLQRRIGPAPQWTEYDPPPRHIPVGAEVLPTELDTSRQARVSAYEVQAPDLYPVELRRRTIRPARLWSEFDPDPPQQRIRRGLLLPELTHRQARVSAFEQETPDLFPDELLLRIARPARHWSEYDPEPPQQRIRRGLLLPELTHRQARVSAFEQQLPDKLPESLYRRRPGLATKWELYDPPGLELPPERFAFFVFVAPGDRRAQVSAYELQTPDLFPDELLQRRIGPAPHWVEYDPPPRHRPVRAEILADELDTSRRGRVSAYEFEAPDLHPVELRRRTIRPSRLWSEYDPEPPQQRRRRGLLLPELTHRQARVSAYELQTPDPFPDELLRRRVGPARIWDEFVPEAFAARRLAHPELLEQTRQARVSAYELEVPAAFPAVFTVPHRGPAPHWDEFAPVLLSSVRVLSGLIDSGADVRARLSALEFQVPESIGDRLARVSAFELEVVEQLPDVLFSRRRAIVAVWDEFDPEEYVPRRVAAVALPGEFARISAFELQLPSGPGRARVSAFEQEVPVADRAARISAYETEIPLVNEQARVSAFAQEVPGVGRARVSAFEFTPDQEPGPESGKRRGALRFKAQLGRRIP